MEKKRELLKRTAAVIVSLAMVAGMFMGTGMDVRASESVTYNTLTDGQHLENGTVVTNNTSNINVYYFKSKETIDAWVREGLSALLPTDLICSFTGTLVTIGVDGSLTGEWNDRDWHVYMNVLVAEEFRTDSVLFLYPCDCPNPAPSTGGQNDSPHTHSFEWTVTKEPTKTQDGLEEYRCRGCGAVEASQPISANMFKVKELYGLVKDAPKGGAVAYDFGDLSTISDYVLGKMAERNDVAVTVSFTYGGEAHSITFPAGTDYAAVLEDVDTMYGFYGVAAKLGLTVE